MAIEYKKPPDGKVEITQIASQPIVYLDTWALNSMVTDNSLGNKFIASLNGKKGTLALSFISLLEVVNRSDAGQVSKILSLIDSVDNVFSDASPGRVIAKEKNRENGTWLTPEILKAVPIAGRLSGPIKMSEIFSLGRDAINKGYKIPEDFEKELLPQLKKYRDDKPIFYKAKKRYQNKAGMLESVFPHTEYLYKRCLDFIVLNKNMNMPDKEWRDVFNFIVPTAYCNFVLIDKRWHHFVYNAGLKPPKIAKAYKQNEIKEFLDDLDIWQG